MAGWKAVFERELQVAADARARGNEGQARVCARRAAGAVVREYFLRQGRPDRASSAFDLLKILPELPDVPNRACQAAEHLTQRVNQDFGLPVTVDLLEEARVLCASLLQGGTEA